MSENKMGDCGSKSVIHETKQSCIIVKEQRVNGSWCGINIPHLRCTLLGFVRSYQVKTLSNQIIQRQFYSSESNLDNSQQPQDPWFISGSPSDYTIGSLDQIITKVRALHPSLRLPLGTQARQEPLILIEL
jgi:hypothetical protein